MVYIFLLLVQIYSWRKWETLAGPIAAEELKARRTKVMRRQSTFVFNNASHPWSKNKKLIWMLCFLRQFKGSIIRSDYLALRLGFVTYHKLPHSYDFHEYMVQSMEDDYNGTIGIRFLDSNNEAFKYTGLEIVSHEIQYGGCVEETGPAGEVQITHRRRNSKLKKGGFADEGSATTESDIEETLKRLVSEVGKSLEEVFEALKNQTVDLVFTAHPTQSARRSLLQKNARIRNCLTQLNARTSLTMTSRSSMRLCREWYVHITFYTKECKNFIKRHSFFDRDRIEHIICVIFGCRW
ncbi:Phosphoenolpyruvate carboxylase 1 [Zea mays]|uniref:Phosphoenolpyruvate carboxylase 1 n=1 Tax=Zea mays TaxID=4577 RepID=A0A3L6D8R4_MAIZE|nr:Phosphoenolpyruvate carboxylase 1 [Zea mays]